MLFKSDDNKSNENLRQQFAFALMISYSYEKSKNIIKVYHVYYYYYYLNKARLCSFNLFCYRRQFVEFGVLELFLTMRSWRWLKHHVRQLFKMIPVPFQINVYQLV